MRRWRGGVGLGLGDARLLRFPLARIACTPVRQFGIFPGGVLRPGPFVDGARCDGVAREGIFVLTELAEKEVVRYFFLLINFYQPTFSVCIGRSWLTQSSKWLAALGHHFGI